MFGERIDGITGDDTHVCYKFKNGLGCVISLFDLPVDDLFIFTPCQVPDDCWDWTKWGFMFTIRYVNGYEMKKLIDYISDPDYKETETEIIESDLKRYLEEIDKVYVEVRDAINELHKRNSRIAKNANGPRPCRF